MYVMINLLCLLSGWISLVPDWCHYWCLIQHLTDMHCVLYIQAYFCSKIFNVTRLFGETLHFLCHRLVHFHLQNRPVHMTDTTLILFNLAEISHTKFNILCYRNEFNDAYSVLAYGKPFKTELFEGSSYIYCKVYRYSKTGHIINEVMLISGRNTCHSLCAFFDCAKVATFSHWSLIRYSQVIYFNFIHWENTRWAKLQLYRVVDAKNGLRHHKGKLDTRR